MSETPKRPYNQVNTVASTIVEALAPACHRIEIAGSLRRRKPMVGDIEIVAIPIMHANLLGDPLDTSEVDDVLARWPVTLSKNGPKYKAFELEWQAGWTFKVDLFLQPDPATWGVNFLIRTGSSDFSHRMVTPRAQGGSMPNDLTVRDARVWRHGVAQETPEEADIFRLWGMQWIDPKERA